MWDDSLGAIQHTRYITPNKKEELLFSFGGYVYLWIDPEVPDSVEPGLPLSFEFPEPDVNEAYVRSSYEPGGIVVGMKKGGLVVHAGGRPVLVDQLNVNDANAPAKPVDEMLVADDGRTAMIRCVGPKESSTGTASSCIDLKLTIRRQTNTELKWWHAVTQNRTETPSSGTMARN
jgi:hypothetical protein